MIVPSQILGVIADLSQALHGARRGDGGERSAGERGVFGALFEGLDGAAKAPRAADVSEAEPQARWRRSGDRSAMAEGRAPGEDDATATGGADDGTATTVLASAAPAPAVIEPVMPEATIPEPAPHETVAADEVAVVASVPVASDDWPAAFRTTESRLPAATAAMANRPLLDESRPAPRVVGHPSAGPDPRPAGRPVELADGSTLRLVTADNPTPVARPVPDDRPVAASAPVRTGEPRPERLVAATVTAQATHFVPPRPVDSVPLRRPDAPRGSVASSDADPELRPAAPDIPELQPARTAAAAPVALDRSGPDAAARPPSVLPEPAAPSEPADPQRRLAVEVGQDRRAVEIPRAAADRAPVVAAAPALASAVDAGPTPFAIGVATSIAAVAGSASSAPPAAAGPAAPVAGVTPAADPVVRTIAITLQLPEHGALDIRMSLHGNALTLHFAAERGDTAERLRSDSAALRDALGEHGYDTSIVRIETRQAAASADMPTANGGGGTLPGQSDGSRQSATPDRQGQSPRHDNNNASDASDDQGKAHHETTSAPRGADRLYV